MKIGVFCASGIGDFLLMMLIANNGNKKHAVTVFHPNHKLFSSLFPNIQCESPVQADLSHFDLILVQNDNSSQAYSLARLRDQGFPVVFLCYKKTPLMKKNDFLFDPSKSCAENLFIAAKNIFTDSSFDNGIQLPEGTYRLNKNQVVLHSMSKDPRRNWPLKKFIALANRLKHDGFSPVFVMTSKEYQGIPSGMIDFPVYQKDTLYDLAQTLYESGFFIGNDSGPGHLASNLKIPTVTISGNPEHVRLWRPGFFDNNVATLPFKLPRFRGININIRENYWHYFMPVEKVYKSFYDLKKRHTL